MGLVENEAPEQIDSKEAKTVRRFHNSVDLVIMNPPFTRNGIRHDQLGSKIEKMVKDREAAIFRDAPVKPDRSSSGLMFLLLGERLCNDTGVLACVFPLSFATAPSASNIRIFLASKFHIDYIVVPHDPKRYWFSENTRISEVLVVMRRGKYERPTKIINLAINPNNAVDAATLASDIRTGRNNKNLRIIEVSKNHIQDGNWHGVQFFSSKLVELFFDIKTSKFFPTQPLGSIADTSTKGGRARVVFDKAGKSDKNSRLAIYGHDTDIIKSMEIEPHTYVVPKKGKDKDAKIVWNNSATLFLPERFQPNLTHVAAINSTIPTVGASWYYIIPHSTITDDKDGWSKAMSVYFNSTIGIISILGNRIPKKPLYPRFSLDGIQNITVPNFSKKQLNHLKKLYEQYAKKPIGLWNDVDDPIRTNLDSAVSEILNLDSEIVDAARLELSKEPMCTGERYMPSEITERDSKK